jgi:hypothetical protein
MEVTIGSVTGASFPVRFESELSEAKHRDCIEIVHDAADSGNPPTSAQ